MCWCWGRLFIFGYIWHVLNLNVFKFMRENLLFLSPSPSRSLSRVLCSNLFMFVWSINKLYNIRFSCASMSVCVFIFSTLSEHYEYLHNLRPCFLFIFYDFRCYISLCCQLFFFLCIKLKVLCHMWWAYLTNSIRQTKLLAHLMRFIWHIELG